MASKKSSVAFLALGICAAAVMIIILYGASIPTEKKVEEETLTFRTEYRTEVSMSEELENFTNFLTSFCHLMLASMTVIKGTLMHKLKDHKLHALPTRTRAAICGSELSNGNLFEYRRIV